MTNLGGRAGAARARRRGSCAPRSATATCSRSCSRAAGSSAARARATCWRSTGTPPATASSAPCWCCRRRSAPAARWPRCSRACASIPQTLINVRLKPGDDWKASPALAARRAEVERELATTGRVLIRPSGTEPLVRVMVEARGRGAGEALRRAAGRVAAPERDRFSAAGGIRTRSTTCTTPLVAVMSACVTSASSIVTKVPALGQGDVGALRGLRRRRS